MKTDVKKFDLQLHCSLSVVIK